MKKIRNLIKEPFVLFLLMGALIFIAYTRTTGYIDHKNRQVHVSQVQMALLAESFQKTWNRPPTADELKAELGRQRAQSDVVP